MRPERTALRWMAAVAVTIGAAVTFQVRVEAAAEPAAPSAATTMPVVSGELFGAAEPVKPPPVVPKVKPTPEKVGGTFIHGVVPSKLKVSVPAVWCFGSGEVTVEGEVNLRLSGDGTVWVDQASSVVLDLGTSTSKTSQDSGWLYERFSGTARVSGSLVRLQAKGSRFYVIGEGRGKVTLNGEGMFRLTDPQRRLVSGVWEKTGVTKDFASLEGQAGGLDFGTKRYGTPPVGLLPVSVPSEAGQPRVPAATPGPMPQGTMPPGPAPVPTPVAPQASPTTGPAAVSPAGPPTAGPAGAGATTGPATSAPPPAAPTTGTAPGGPPAP